MTLCPTDVVSCFVPLAFCIASCLAESGLHGQLAGSGIQLQVAYPLDTSTPGYETETLTKVSSTLQCNPTCRPHPVTMGLQRPSALHRVMETRIAATCHASCLCLVLM